MQHIIHLREIEESRHLRWDLPHHFGVGNCRCRCGSARRDFQTLAGTFQDEGIRRDEHRTVLRIRMHRGNPLVALRGVARLTGCGREKKRRLFRRRDRQPPWWICALRERLRRRNPAHYLRAFGLAGTRVPLCRWSRLAAQTLEQSLHYAPDFAPRGDFVVGVRD